MSEHIPAWKRIGLKVKEELENDPLALTTHLDTGNLTKKQQKKITKRVRTDEQEGTVDKKPAKRQKLPKSERAPPPEKDQLVYLKTYTTEKDSWKFSKQKQNWILKHVKVIDQDYEEYLINYFAGLQGGGKERMADILRDVIESWNKLQETSSEEKKEEKIKEEPKGKLKPKKKDMHDELTSVDADYAVRAKKILKAMTGEEPVLKGIDDAEKTEKTEEERKVEEKDEAKEEDSDESGGDSRDSGDSDGDSTETSSESESDSNSSESLSRSESDESITSAPSEKSSKKPKEQNPLSNLIIEQVEVSDFVSEADFQNKSATKTPFPQSGNSNKERKSKKGKSTKSKKD
jgi:hypothetical protein